MKKCVLCVESFDGYGNNAYPLKEGRCCDDCNLLKVVPTRLKSEKINGYIIDYSIINWSLVGFFTMK